MIVRMGRRLRSVGVYREDVNAVRVGVDQSVESDPAPGEQVSGMGSGTH